jgi:hypothetical protein
MYRFAQFGHCACKPLNCAGAVASCRQNGQIAVAVADMTRPRSMGKDMKYRSTTDYPGKSLRTQQKKAEFFADFCRPAY